ncbi:MAG: hypothetical protein ACRYFS_18330 [Janthinobacterium lividum]
MLLVQLLVLAFTGALWWIARRDLAARPKASVLPAPTVDTAELEQLCATLETLVTSLSRRLEAVERQLTTAMRPGLVSSGNEIEEIRVDNNAPEAFASAPPSFGPRIDSEPVADPRYAPVYALLEAGVFDPVEIARQTGLGRGEVDLILSLRDRRAF